MKKTQKLLFSTLLAATLSSGILSACTKKESADAEKEELRSATETQERMSAEASDRQQALDTLIAENEALRANLEAEQADLDARIQSHAEEREMRERQMMALTMTISNYQVQLEELEQAHAAAAAALAAEEEGLAQRRAVIAATMTALEAEREQLRGQISAENANLVDIQTRIATAEADLASAIETIMDEARNQAQALIDGARSDSAQARAAAETEAASILSAAETQAAALRSEAEVSISADRQAFQDEITSRSTAIEEAELAAIARQAELNAQQQQLEREQTQLAQDLAILASQQSELATAQTLLAQNQATLAADMEEFSNQMTAAREFFTNQGQEDVFDTITANETYTFRMSLWGYGSVKNILKIRKKMKEFNDSQNQSSQNSNIEYSPRLLAPIGDNEGINFEDLTEAEVEALQRANYETFGDAARYLYENAAVFTLESLTDIDIQIVRDVNEKVVTRDSYMITGTATTVKAFRDELNQLLGELANGEDGVQSANMWVSAQPVQNVRVNMTMKLIGSADTSFNRNHETIAVFSKIRPYDTGARQLVDVQINSPAQYVFTNEANQSICEQVSKDCLAAIKDSGLLNSENTFEYQDANGNTQRETMSYSQILEQVLEGSIQKLRLQRVISRLEGEGILVQLRVRPVTRNPLFGSRYTEWVYDESQLEEQVADVEANRDLLETLHSQPVLEKIEINYEIVMVDVIDGNSAALNLGEYLQAGRIRGTDIRSGELSRRGEIEVPLPYRTIEASESRFTDLTLAGFQPQATAPVNPISDADLEILGETILIDLVSNFEYAGRDAEALNTVHSYNLQRSMIQTDAEAAAAFDRAVSVLPEYVAYKEALVDYQASVQRERERAYMHRSEQLIGELSFLKTDLFGNDNE